MSLTLVTPAAASVVEIEELKDHLRIALSVVDEDNALLRLIAMATESAERYLRRPLLTQTFRESRDAFPCGREWRLQKPPLQTVSSVQYLDRSGTLQTMDADDYVVDAPSGPDAVHGRIVLADGAYWPSPGVCTANVARVEFVAGYGDSSSDVPEPIRHGILLLASQMYEHREPVVTGMTATAMPMSIEYLWSPYRALVW